MLREQAQIYRKNGILQYVSLRLLVVALIQGCAIKSPIKGLSPDVHARIQVCLPTKIVKFTDIVIDEVGNHPLFPHYSKEQLEAAPKTIRRVTKSNAPHAIKDLTIPFGDVLNQDGVFSEGGGHISLIDSTVEDQPVFEPGFTRPARVYLAVRVSGPDPRPGQGGRVNYWFNLPQHLPTGEFTEWFSPVSMEPEGLQKPVGWVLVHGGAMAIYPVFGDVPKIRISLAKLANKHTDPATDSLPALTTARLRFKTAESNQNFVYEFVGKTGDVIPSCR